MKNFKKLTKRTLAVLMVAVMLICAAPLDGFMSTDWSDFALTVSATERIVGIEVEDVVVSEGTRGSMHAYSDENGEEQYWFWYYIEPQALTVTLSDGTSRTYDDMMDFDRDFYESYYRSVVEQTFENPWVAGRTYECVFTVNGVSDSYNITIAESDIESVVAHDNTVIELTRGMMRDGDYEDEYGNYITGKFFSYEANPLAVTINYKNGTSETLEYPSFWGYNEKTGMLAQYVNDQSLDNQWGVGTHKAVLLYGNFVCEYNFEIIECPYTNISIAPMTVREKTHGMWEGPGYEWDDDLGQNVEYDSYFRYELWDWGMEVVLTTKDGGRVTYTYSEMGDEDTFGTYPDLISDQSPWNPWGPGTHPVTIKFSTLTGEFDFTVEECPVVGISAEPIEILEGTHGSIQEGWFEGYDEYVSYWHYDVEPQITVYYNDGTSFTGYEWEVENEIGYELRIYTDQEYNNQWDVGEHTARVVLNDMNLTAEFTVNIVEELSVGNKIIDIEVEPVEIVEGTSCYRYSDEIFDENGDYSCTDEYWRYDISPEEITVYFEDGKAVTGDIWDIEEIFDYEYNVTISDNQSYDNQWGVGTHTATLGFMGKSVDFTVTITESPIANIVVDDAVIYEGTHGYFDWIYDENDENTGERRFEYNVNPERITVTFNDGSTKVYEYTEGDFEDFYWDTGLSWHHYDDQSSSNIWGIGEHTAYFEVGIHTYEYTVTIVESNIESISVEDVEVLENIDGWFWEINDEDGMPTEEKWFYYDVKPETITIKYKDGTSKTYEKSVDDFDDLREETDLYWDYIHDQSQDNIWGVGEHTATFLSYKHTCDYTVEVIKNPIVRIEVPTVYICEGKNGYLENWGEEDEYYYYELLNYDFDVNIVLNNGDVHVYSISELWELGVNPQIETDQSAENPWIDGAHKATISFMGYEAEFDVEFCRHQNSREYSEIPADCRFYGYTAGVYCPDCEVWREGRDIIQKIEHMDKDNNDECDVCGASLALERYESMLNRFLFYTESVFDEDENAPENFIFWYVTTAGLVREYYDADRDVYTVPYSDYIRIVDETFVNHSDMKEYLRDNDLFADEDEDTVEWSFGGMGDASTMLLTEVYDYGNGKIGLRGVYISYHDENLPDNGKHYYKYVDERRNEFGEIESDVSYWRIGGAYELTILKTEGREKLLSFKNLDKCPVDDDLYTFDDGKVDGVYNRLDIECGDGATVVSDGAPLTDKLLTFEGYDGYWCENGSEIVFDIEIEDGYELVSISIQDTEGYVDITHLITGEFSIILESNTVLQVVTSRVDVHTHSYNAVVTVPPTCRESGVMTYTCDCGHSYTEEIEPTGEHQEDNGTITEATCGMDGFIEYRCVLCNDLLNKEILPATGEHKSDEGTVVQEATCYQDGIIEYYCLDCGENIGTEILATVGIHAFGDWEVTKEPTAFEDGEEKRICRFCDEFETRVIERDIIPVTGVLLDMSAVALTKGETKTLTATVLPEEATNKNVSWSSSDENVATVENGVITAINNGTAVITVTTEDGNKTASCTVTVTEVEFDENKPYIEVSSARARVGDTVTVAVRFVNNPGIAAFALGFDYDETVLSLESVELNPEVGGSLEYETQAVWYTIGDTSFSGDFVILTFKVLDTAFVGTTPVSVTFEADNIMNYDEEIVSFAVKGGAIEIYNHLPGDINGDGEVNNKDLNRLQKYFAGKEVEVVEAALDITGDGRLNTMDIIRLVKYLTGEPVEIF